MLDNLSKKVTDDIIKNLTAARAAAAKTPTSASLSMYFTTSQQPLPHGQCQVYLKELDKWVDVKRKHEAAVYEEEPN